MHVDPGSRFSPTADQMLTVSCSGRRSGTRASEITTRKSAFQVRSCKPVKLTRNAHIRPISVRFPTQVQGWSAADRYSLIASRTVKCKAHAGGKPVCLTQAVRHRVGHLRTKKEYRFALVAASSSHRTLAGFFALAFNLSNADSS